MVKARRWWLVLLLSILSPGVGYLYLGKARKGIFVVLLMSLLIPLALFLGRWSGYWFLLLQLLLTLLHFIVIVMCIITARRQTKHELKGYQRWYVYPSAIAVVLSILGSVTIISRKFISEPYRFRSTSMQPTLQTGDFVMADKLYYKWHPLNRGDVVIFRREDDPATRDDESSVTTIKRIVALGGDTVSLDHTHLFVNGSEVDEGAHTIYKDGGVVGFKEQLVPQGHVFLLGDNRDASKDSRFYRPPFVSAELIAGRVTHLFWPLRRIDSQIR